MRLSELAPPLWQDALSLLCGNRIGDGISRAVFECELNAEWVVKVCYSGDKRFQNQYEWRFWDNAQEAPDVKKWLAPCLHISQAGNFLIQRRTTPVTIAELRKKVPRVPRFLTDLKPANWGRIGKNIVCHDYGTALMELTSGMKKADWWE